MVPRASAATAAVPLGPDDRREPARAAVLVRNLFGEGGNLGFHARSSTPRSGVAEDACRTSLRISAWVACGGRGGGCAILGGGGSGRGRGQIRLVHVRKVPLETALERTVLWVRSPV